MRLWTFVPCILEYFKHGLQANRPVFGLSIDCSVSTTCWGSMPTKWPTDWVHRPHPCVLTSCMLLRLLKTVENQRQNPSTPRQASTCFVQIQAKVNIYETSLEFRFIVLPHHFPSHSSHIH